MPLLSLVASDQVKLHVETAGSGDAVVLIPGLGGVGSFWHPVRPALTDRFRTILIDHRGTGKSDKPLGPYRIARIAQDVLDVLDALQIQKAHLVGHSTGGVIAQHLALNAPSRVGRLVLSATWCQPDEHFRLLFETRLAVLEQSTPATYAHLSLLLGYPPGWFVGRDNEVAKITAAAAADTTPREIAAARIRMLIDDSTIPNPDRIMSEVLILGASDDAIVPFHHSAMLAGIIPGARLLRIDGGHFFPRVHPDKVGAALREFLIT